MNEILELMTRKTGILGMGINAGPSIDNMDEQAEMLCTGLVLLHFTLLHIGDVSFPSP